MRQGITAVVLAEKECCYFKSDLCIASGLLCKDKVDKCKWFHEAVIYNVIYDDRYSKLDLLDFAPPEMRRCTIRGQKK
jgi:hypothetical protein